MVTVGVKVGTSLVVKNNNEINKEFIAELCHQVKTLILRAGYSVFIVTSGAVHSDPKSHRSKNLRAAVGQPKLMRYYLDYFDAYNIEVGQWLLVDGDLVSGRTRVTRRTISEAFKERIVPIINGNDPVDDEEIMAMEQCADNDKLFKLACKLMKANMAIIGFDSEGVKDDKGNIIREVSHRNFAKVLSCAQGGSGVGHGDNGMRTKIEVLSKLANFGIKSMLAPGKTDNFLIRAINRLQNGKKDFGTLFLP